jgi:hypothetical protein
MRIDPRKSEPRTQRSGVSGADFRGSIRNAAPFVGMRESLPAKADDQDDNMN